MTPLAIWAICLALAGIILSPICMGTLVVSGRGEG